MDSDRRHLLADAAHEAAHDSLNWLAAALGHLDRAETAELDPAVREALGRVRASLHACVALQEDTLQFARGEAATPAEPRTRTGLRRIVEASAEAFRGRVNEGVGFHVHVHRECLARVAPQALANVLQNLLANALRATPAGEVTLGLRAHGDRAVVWVDDTGCGMDLDTLARCRDDGFTTSGGSGLGLAQAHRVARTHGGELAIQSEPGRGTRVELHLPLAESSSVANAGILLVEDDPHVAEVILEWCRTAGRTADHAWDAAEALDRLRDTTPDIVLIDVGLPDRDGVDLAKQIRQSAPALGIVLLTGQGASLDPARAASVADQVLRKPVDFDVLHHALLQVRPHRDDPTKTLEARSGE